MNSELARVRHELQTIVTSHDAVTKDNAKPLAWELYEAFLRILDVAQADAARDRTSQYHGFISYRRESAADAALAIHAKLQTRGLNTFLDVEGLDSGAFGPRLLREIERAPSFLLILTPGCLGRCQQTGDWLRQEIVHAIETKRNIIPVFKDGFLFPDPANLPTDIRTLPDNQGVSYSHEYFSAVIDRIEKYMRSALSD
jgi:hypothetical protein